MNKVWKIGSLLVSNRFKTLMREIYSNEETGNKYYRILNELIKMWKTTCRGDITNTTISVKNFHR